MHDGKITVTGGELRFDGGVDSHHIGGATINVSSGGLLHSTADVSSTFVNTHVTITGGEFRTNHDVTFAVSMGTLSLTITGGGRFDIQGADFHASPDGTVRMPIIINGNFDVTSLKCDHFTMFRTDLSIAGGKFHVVGDEGSCDTFWASTLTLSGGTYYAGGTFDGDATSDVIVSGGVLDIRADFPSEPDLGFRHRGLFSFTGGKIKVKKDKIVHIGPD